MVKILIGLVVFALALPPLLSYLKRRAIKKKELKDAEQIIPLESEGQAYLISIKKVKFRD